MGAPNLRFFLARVSKATKDTPPKLAQRGHRLLLVAGIQGVVVRSPVDTGRFRGNNQVANGTPALDVLNTLDPSGGATIAEGTRVADAAKPFETSYVTNNLPYGPSLEEGSSSQAPAGVYAVTAEELESLDIDRLLGVNDLEKIA